MERLKTDIIPTSPIFIGDKKTLDTKAICLFAATGFFLDQDTYFEELKVLKPGHDYSIGPENKIISEKPYFEWHYKPKQRSLGDVVEEFSILFESIIKEQVGDKKVILPLSGGLDSRTQAAALKHLNLPVHTYSYSFDGGHPEIKYGREIAEKCGFDFEEFTVREGYLWEVIDELANINECYSEFTHPRQMAFIESYGKLGDIFSLGHWGDVLFDDMGVEDTIPFEKRVEVLIKKIVVKGGLALGSSLWDMFSLEGEFSDYLVDRIKSCLREIKIHHSANAQIRGFKSRYWAPRWTSTNLSVFNSVKPLGLPYYDNKMCEFICTIPESLLSGRQIQIEYIKRRNPELAKISWQANRPFNLYNYRLNRSPINLPYRIINKIKRSINSKSYIQRNWELQFIGQNNDLNLKRRLFEVKEFNEFIDPKITFKFYNLFKKEDSVFYSHPLSMLLTLSLFSSKFLKSKE